MYSVLEILRSAGFRTSWISNQAQWGLWGIGTSLIASGADDVFFAREDKGDSSGPLVLQDSEGRMMTAQDYDSNNALDDADLLPRIDKVLAEEKGPAVLFVHLMGSHAPYFNRYPPAFKKFGDAEDAALFGDKINAAHVNGYDNSIRYTDYILDQIIQKLERKGGPASLLYFSDHGESVDLNKQHDPSDFTPGHVEVPLLLWTSEAYRAAYPDVILQAQAHAKAPFMNDVLTQTVMGLVHIHGPFTNPAHNLLSSEFTPSPRRTMDGAVDYDALPESYCAIVKAKTGYGLGACSAAP